MDVFKHQKQVALLVIDMQADFYAPHGSAAKRGKKVKIMQGTAAKINQFVGKVEHKIGVMVFTKYLSGRGITPANLKKVAAKGGYELSCRKGSGMEEFSGITVPKKALIVEKPHFDAFAYTDLFKILRKKKISTVLVSGVRTEVCVDATAKRAASEGFDTVILSDLVATYDDKMKLHEDILAFYNNYYGFVMKSSDVLKSI